MNMVPILPTPMVRPASSHQRLNSSRPSLSASVSVWRLLPPATPGPIFAICISESHKRSGLIRRFSPGAAIGFKDSHSIPSERPAVPDAGLACDRGSVDLVQYRADAVDDFVDVPLLDDQRRRQRDDVPGGADQQAFLECPHEGGEGALARLAVDRTKLDRADEADIAHVDDMRRILQ